MPLKMFRCAEDSRLISLEGCQKCCATWSAPCSMIPPILNSIIENLKEEETVEGIHVSSLTGCIRSEYIKAKYDYAINPEDLHYLWRGRLFHSLLEKFPGTEGEEVVKETRFQREYNGIIFTGKPDLILPVTGLLVDFKSTRKVPDRFPYKNHTVQVNLYRWLLKGIQPEIKRLLVIYLDMNSCVVREAKIWEEAALLKYFAKAIAISKAITDNILPPYPPPDEDLWNCDYCNVKTICLNLLKEGR